jgi:hypothetical protein
MKSVDRLLIALQFSKRTFQSGFPMKRKEKLNKLLGKVWKFERFEWTAKRLLECRKFSNIKKKGSLVKALLLLVQEAGSS